MKKRKEPLRPDHKNHKHRMKSSSEGAYREGILIHDHTAELEAIHNDTVHEFLS